MSYQKEKDFGEGPVRSPLIPPPFQSTQHTQRTLLIQPGPASPLYPKIAIPAGMIPLTSSQRPESPPHPHHPDQQVGHLARKSMPGAGGAGAHQGPARQGPRTAADQEPQGDDAQDALRRGQQDVGHVRDADSQAFDRVSACYLFFLPWRHSDVG